MRVLLFVVAVLTYVVNTTYAKVHFKVICSPQDYNGVSVSVNIDGSSYPMNSVNQDILYEFDYENVPQQYYYEVTGTAGVAHSELTIIGQARAWDPQSTTTFYEIYGRKNAIGDDLIKTIPRLYEPLEGYEKYSILFQEGEVPVINLKLNDMDYNTLITQQSGDLNLKVEFDFYTPYEKYQFTNVTLNFSGQGSRSKEKKPYKFDLSGDKTDKFNSQIFSRKEFKLRSLRYDESYMKNKLVEDMAESLGLPITQSAPCRLYINNISYGLYELSDMYKKKFIRRFFNPQKNGDDYIYGSLYKAVSVVVVEQEPVKQVPAYLYTDTDKADISSLYESVVSPNPMDPLADINNMIQWINALPENASKEEIEQKFDIDMFLKYMAIEYLTCHWDGLIGHGNNFFIYIEPNDAKYHVFSYDFDITLGKWCPAGASQGNFDEYVNKVTEDYGTQPKRLPLLYTKILNNPNIKPIFDNLIKEILENLFNIEALGPRIDYFYEFFKQDMYWDSYCLANTIKTIGNDSAKIEIGTIDQQYSDASTNPEDLKYYIKFRSTDASQYYGISAFKNEGKYGTVGGKIMALEDDDDVDDSKK